jgi:fatty acid desaturase
MERQHEPLKEVRESFSVPWYRCPIDRKELQTLSKRRNLRGWVQAVGHLLLLAATGGITYYCFAEGIWVGFGLGLFAHGTIYSFIPGLVTHELSHGTVFATKSLNAFFLRLYSLISWTDFHHYKRSHTFHHLYTLHPRGDREVVLPINPRLDALQILWLFTFNVPRFRLVLRNTVRLAFTKRFSREWSDAIFPPEAQAARRQAVNWARIMLAFHGALIAVSIVLQLWVLPLLITFGIFIANWWAYFIGLTMHTGLRDNVPDFRLCCRSIKLDPFSQFIYWYMNYHTEHHMYAAIPCYNLPKLAKTIAWDMPQPRTVAGAWREMRETHRRQQKDPSYQYDTPLPEHNRTDDNEEDELRGSIGDLAPKDLD